MKKMTTFTVLLTIVHDDTDHPMGSRIASAIGKALSVDGRDATANTWTGDQIKNSTANIDYVRQAQANTFLGLKA